MTHNKEQLTTELLAWYDQYARILPWRSQPTPYHVWVSEIMLQQTRVEAVKPYFDRFINEFPDIASLASAKDDELVKIWEGLGYYNRVRNMKKCAIQCMEEYQGQLPTTKAELFMLPGIGSYTAGAIASIAYKEQVAAVDGNVLRVFSRVLESYDDVLKGATKKKFEKILLEYIPKDRPDAFNQALMEIGAMICVPNAAPRCNICPLAKNCLGYQRGTMSLLPNKTKKKPRKIEEKDVYVIVCKDKVLMKQRDKKGLLFGLYEFLVADTYQTREQIQLRLSKYWRIKKIYPLPESKHIFTHIEWKMKGYLIVVEDIDQEHLWVTKKEIENVYAIPTAYKIYKQSLLEWWNGSN